MKCDLVGSCSIVPMHFQMLSISCECIADYMQRPLNAHEDACTYKHRIIGSSSTTERCTLAVRSLSRCQMHATALGDWQSVGNMVCSNSAALPGPSCRQTHDEISQFVTAGGARASSHDYVAYNDRWLARKTATPTRIVSCSIVNARVHAIAF